MFRVNSRFALRCLEEISEAYIGTELACDEILNQISAKQVSVEDKMEDLEAAELDHIYKSIGLSGGSEALGIKNAYDELVEINMVADEARASAIFGGANKGKGGWIEKCLWMGGLQLEHTKQYWRAPS